MPSNDQERLARILDDYLVSIERGLPVSPEDLLEKYPEDAAQLRGYLSGLQLFHAAAGVSPALAGGALPNASLPQPMQTIGDYQLMREIGRGGMGVVYEAWQLSLKRRVALKILPFTAAHDAKQIGRFKNEAQAAAQVQHPNIVPVFAVGEENGVHYYVMQLVEGQSLTSLLDGLRTIGRGAHRTTAANHPNLTLLLPNARYRASTIADGQLRTNSPSVGNESPNIIPMRAAETADHIQAIARLALQAAGALHAAHEYGVVHRDVKPSNLLLDDQGKLWVTDFGLARCREDSGLTQTGDVLGTMRYMSPEQAMGRAALVDQRTDIYSLGITMYELATLHHPADDVSNLQCYFDCNKQPPKPLRHWNRHIPRDFQTIVLKCVAEFPHERYSTAKELADDLERFLDGRPIMASPPSWLSRAGKWAKRRRGVVYASAAVLFLAITGAIATTMMIAHERNAGNERALNQTREFLKESVAFNLDKYADQLAAIPGAEGVGHQMLEDGVQYFERYEKAAADDPALATDWAVAQTKLGMLNEKLHNKKEALEAHTRAVEVWQVQVARDPSDVEKARNLALAQNNLGMILQQDGQLAKSLEWLTKARDSLAALRKTAPDSNSVAADLATTQGNIGMVLMESSDKQAAIKEFSDAIQIGRQVTEQSDSNESALRCLAACYSNLGMLHDIGQPILANEDFNNSISIGLQLVKANPINRLYRADLARAYSNQGLLSSRTKDWANAKIQFGKAIVIQEELAKSSPLAGAYRRDLAISYNNLGMVQSNTGQLDDAESLFQKSVHLQDEILAVAPGDADILSNQGGVWNNLGMLYDRKEKYPDAEAAFQHAIDHERRALESAKTNLRYRAMLSEYCINSARNLFRQFKYDAAVEVLLERKQLWPGQPEKLYSVARQLAIMYGKMRASNAEAKTQVNCAQSAVATLREAVAAGLPNDRLSDPTLAVLANTREYQQLLAGSHASTGPAAANQAAITKSANGQN